MFPSRRVALSGDAFRDEFSFFFDGTDANGIMNKNLGASFGANYAGDISLSVWFKCHTIGNNGFFQIGDHNNGDFSVRIHSSKIKYGLNNAGWEIHYGFTDTTSWHHLVAVLDGENEAGCLLYVDGVSVGAIDGTPSFPAVNDLDLHNSISRVGLVHTSYFYGWMSDMALYNTALTSYQIKNIYNSREPYNHKEGIARDALVAWWRFGDGRLDKYTGGSSYKAIIGDEVNPNIGPELITDPEFNKEDVAASSSETYWQCEANWEIDKDATDAPGNLGQAIASSATTNISSKTEILTTDRIYRVRFQLSSVTGGDIRPVCGAANGNLQNANGIYEEYIRCTTSIYFHFDAQSPFTGKVDWVSCKEVLGYPCVLGSTVDNDYGHGGPS